MMPLINSEIVEVSQHKHHKRARFRYTFDTGHIIDVGPVQIPDGQTASQRLVELESHAIKQAKKRSYRNLSDIVDSGEATKADIAKYFLEKAMRAETVEAYFLLKKFNTFRQSQGWTPAQVKAALNIDDETWQDIANRWQYLNSNASAIESFATVQRGDN